MKRNAIYLALTLIAILVVLSLARVYAVRFKPAPAPAPASTAGPDATGAGPIMSCVGCAGLTDNGRTLDLREASRLTLELPRAVYDPESISFDPEGHFSQTFGATPGPGDWVRTFAAVNAGTTTLRIPSEDPRFSDYVLVLHVTAGE